MMAVESRREESGGLKGKSVQIILASNFDIEKAFWLHCYATGSYLPV